MKMKKEFSYTSLTKQMALPVEVCPQACVKVKRIPIITDFDGSRRI